MNCVEAYSEGLKGEWVAKTAGRWSESIRWLGFYSCLPNDHIARIIMMKPKAAITMMFSQMLMA